MVKIDLGVHIDGNIAVLGHTTIATAVPAAAVSGRKADVVCAAHFAAEVIWFFFLVGFVLISD